MSKKTNDEMDIVEVANEVTEPEVINEEAEVKTESEPERKPTFGFVVGCDNLNIRKEASKESDILGVLKRGSETLVEEIEGNPEWYAISTAQSMKGFCMSKFIRVKR